MSVLYVCPLKALLNNLAAAPARRTRRGSGRSVGAVARRRRRARRGSASCASAPDILLTTPESLEAMLVSTNVDHRQFFSATCGPSSSTRSTPSPATTAAGTCSPCSSGSRGSAGGRCSASGCPRPSATPTTADLAAGSRAAGPSGVASSPAERPAGAGFGRRPTSSSTTSAPSTTRPRSSPPCTAARSGWCSATAAALVEELGAALRERGVTTFLSHASLSLDERRRAEAAFAEARDCVIVATSHAGAGHRRRRPRPGHPDQRAGLGGVVPAAPRPHRAPARNRPQLPVPRARRAVAAVGGRPAAAVGHGLGRAGRRAARAPPHRRPAAPRPVPAGTPASDDDLWQEWWNGLGSVRPERRADRRHLLAEGYLEQDGGMLFIGPEAETRFGRRHFMDLTAVFTAPPQFTVLQGHREIGRIDPVAADRAGRRAPAAPARGPVAGGSPTSTGDGGAASSSPPIAEAGPDGSPAAGRAARSP